MNRLLRVTACMLLLTARLAAAPVSIRTDTMWSGEGTLDDKVLVSKGTLTIALGATIRFRPGGEINVQVGAALTAKGSEAQPIEFSGGDKAGVILSNDGTLLLELRPS